VIIRFRICVKRRIALGEKLAQLAASRDTWAQLAGNGFLPASNYRVVGLAAGQTQVGSPLRHRQLRTGGGHGPAHIRGMGNGGTSP
jgi:hypothetical protein